MKERPFKREFNKRTEYPDDVVKSKILKKSEIAVLLHLARYLPNAFPSYDRLALDCNVSRETVKRAISALKYYGAIKIIGKGGYHKRANMYAVFDTPEMWEANTEEEFIAACQLAQQKYNNKVEIAKKESPTPVGADEGDNAEKNNNDNLDYCITKEATCQPEPAEPIEHIAEEINKILPWTSQEECGKIVTEAQKVIQEDEILPYIRFCVSQMQAEEDKGTKIRTKFGYLIIVIRRMPEQYRANKVKTTPQPPKYDPLYDDAEWLYAKFHGKEDGS